MSSITVRQLVAGVVAAAVIITLIVFGRRRSSDKMGGGGALRWDIGSLLMLHTAHDDNLTNMIFERVFEPPPGDDAAVGVCDDASHRGPYLLLHELATADHSDAGTQWLSLQTALAASLTWYAEVRGGTVVLPQHSWTLGQDGSIAAVEFSSLFDAEHAVRWLALRGVSACSGHARWRSQRALWPRIYTSNRVNVLDEPLTAEQQVEAWRAAAREAGVDERGADVFVMGAYNFGGPHPMSIPLAAAGAVRAGWSMRAVAERVAQRMRLEVGANCTVVGVFTTADTDERLVEKAVRAYVSEQRADCSAVYAAGGGGGGGGGQKKGAASHAFGNVAQLVRKETLADEDVSSMFAEQRDVVDAEVLVRNCEHFVGDARHPLTYVVANRRKLSQRSVELLYEDDAPPYLRMN